MSNGWADEVIQEMDAQTRAHDRLDVLKRRAAQEGFNDHIEFGIVLLLERDREHRDWHDRHGAPPGFRLAGLVGAFVAGAAGWITGWLGPRPT